MHEETNKRKIAWKNARRRMDNYGSIKEVQGIKLSPEDLTTEPSSSAVDVRVFHETVLDTLRAVLGYKIPDLKVLVVNSTSDIYPNDALKTGAEGHDFDMCRLTSIFASFEETMFPLRGEMIYSPKVHVLKTNHRFAALTLCPPRHPKLMSFRTDGHSKEDYENVNDKEQMKQKITHIFQVAIKYQHNCLIIPNLGCGSEGNPADMVAEMFNDILQTHRIRYIFIGAKHEEKIARDQSFQTFHKLIIRHIDGQNEDFPNDEDIENELLMTKSDPEEDLENLEELDSLENLEALEDDLESEENEEN